MMEDIKPHNPNAFPLIADDYIQDGMTLRDYFAAKAMIIIPAPIDYMGGKETKNSLIAFCKKAYEVADAMLKEREKHD